MGTVDVSNHTTGIARNRRRLAVKGDIDRSCPDGILDIVAIVQCILILWNRLGWFGQLAVIKENFFGSDGFLDIAPQDDVDHGIDVGNIYFAVTVDVGSERARIATTQDDVNDGINVADAHLAVAIDVTC